MPNCGPEAFNLFNHTEFSGVEKGIGSSTFGQVVAAYPTRIVQIALRLSF
jgi:hypothetical protein